MKSPSLMNKLALLIFSLLISFLSFAQDKKVDVDINVGKDSHQWYTQPWVWIVGAAVFILLLVAILRGNRSNN